MLSLGLNGNLFTEIPFFISDFSQVGSGVNTVFNGKEQGHAWTMLSSFNEQRSFPQLTFHPLTFPPKKKIKFLSAIPYDTFCFFFSPFPALVHVKMHVFPWPTHLEAHLCQLTVQFLSIKKKKSSKTVHKKGTNTWNLSITWQKKDTMGDLCKNLLLLQDIVQSFLIQWTNTKQTDPVEENRTQERIDWLDEKIKS